MISSEYLRYALYTALGAALLWALHSSGGPRQGGSAPDFDLPLVTESGASGTRVSLTATHDRPLLIEVFASWCGTCRRAAPALAEAHAKYGDKIEFLGVSVDDHRDAAAHAQRAWGIPYQVAHDERGAFAKAYHVRVLPTFVLVDRKGRIERVSTGMPSAARLEEWAASLDK